MPSEREKREEIRKYNKGERVKYKDHYYIFIGQNHDYNALLVPVNEEDEIDNRVKACPFQLTKSRYPNL